MLIRFRSLTVFTGPAGGPAGMFPGWRTCSAAGSARSRGPGPPDGGRPVPLLTPAQVDAILDGVRPAGSRVRAVDRVGS
jgi:hypothetical protein